MPQFQYQQLAEPSAAAATTERTQVDKWYQPAVPPPRSRRRELDYHGFNEPTLRPLLPSYPSSWQHFYPDRQRPLPRWTMTEETRLDVLGAAPGPGPVMDWYVPATEPRRYPSRRLEDLYGSVLLVTPPVAGEGYFPHDYFAITYFPGTYFPPTGGAPVAVTLASWLGSYPSYLAPLPRTTFLEGSNNFWANFAAAFDPATGFPWQPTSVAPRALRHVPDSLGDYAFTVNAFAGETTQLGKWWTPASEPPRPLPHAYLGDFTTSVSAFSQETTQLGKWWRQSPEPPRPLRHHWLGDYATTLGVFTVETTQLNKWWQPTSQAPRSLPRAALQDTGATNFWQNFVGIFNPASGFSYEQASEPPRPLPRSYLGTFATTVGVFEQAAADRWYQPASTPPRALEHRWLGDSATTLGVFTVETTQLDKWWQPTSTPPRPPARAALQDTGVNNFWQNFVGIFNPALGFPYEQAPEPPRPLPHAYLGGFTTTVGVFEAAAVDRWYQPTSTPPRPLPHRWLGAYGTTLGVYTVETTQVDKWWQPAALPVRPPQRAALQDTAVNNFWQNFAAIFNPASGFPYMPMSESPRPLKHVPYQLGLDGYGEGVFVVETAQVDKWWQPAALPVRPLPQVAPVAVGVDNFWQNFAAIFDPDAGFPYSVTSEAPRPLKHIPYQLGLDGYGEGVFVLETITVDKWLGSYPDLLFRLHVLVMLFGGEVLPPQPGPVPPGPPTPAPGAPPVTGLREGEGGTGGYLVPPQLLGQKPFTGEVTPSSRRPPELRTYPYDPWQEEQKSQAAARERQDEEDLLLLLLFLLGEDEEV